MEVERIKGSKALSAALKVSSQAELHETLFQTNKHNDCVNWLSGHSLLNIYKCHPFSSSTTPNSSCIIPNSEGLTANGLDFHEGGFHP